jgi:ribosomal protein S27AE
MMQNEQKNISKSDGYDDISNQYKEALNRVINEKNSGESKITQFFDEIGEDAHAIKELSQDKVALLEAYVKRDLLDAANYLNSTGKTLQDWLGFDIALIESKLWHTFSQAADQTTLELIKLREQAYLQTYRTGESIGVGTLKCDACGAKLNFHGPSRIPPCGQCHHTEFHRVTRRPD